MNEKTINDQHTIICHFLEKQRLKEALLQLESFLWQCSDWNIKDRVEQIQSAYNLMLQYFRQGADDQQRSTVYQKLLTDTWEIADQAQMIMLNDASTHQTFEYCRKFKSGELKKLGLQQILYILESHNDNLAVAKLVSPDQVDSTLKSYEEALKNMFLQTWTNFSWSSEDEENAKAILHSETTPVNGKCILTSSVTLSLMECFDIKKMMWLTEAYQNENMHIKQRALIGIIIAIHIYKSRILLYPKFCAKMSALEENTTLQTDVSQLNLQFLLSQETEKIDRKMREEIIPGMMKSVKKMEEFNLDMDAPDEENNGLNPDWKKAIEESQLDKSLIEMNNLQAEGADIYMSTFTPLKGYAFFREIQNWFYPFDKSHSSVIKMVDEKQGDNDTVLNVILSSSALCNSDKYSLYLTVGQLPPPQQKMILSQLGSQEMEMLKEQMNEPQSLAKLAQEISNQYLHDLYRFFKLYPRHYEFRDIFKEKLQLFKLPILDDILYDSANLYYMTEFFFKKERWEEASDILQSLADLGTDNTHADLYQKQGFAFQKQKRYAEAISAYQKADAIVADNVWTNRQLAICYRLTHNYPQAISYYRKAAAVDPDNRNIIYYMASCLAENKEYDEALNHFFKLDFIENDSVKAWRGIAWCSFAKKKNEQAMKYYQKIMEKKPTFLDYLNAGHVAWAMKEVDKAVTYYGKSHQIFNGDKQQFIDLFNKDKELLLEHQILESDIPLILDIVLS